jgi:hypothetical protein
MPLQIGLRSDLGGPESIVAQLLAMLAYPAEGQGSKRTTVAIELWGRCLSDSIVKGLRDEGSLTPLENSVVFHCGRARSGIDHAVNTIRNRLEAGHCGAAILLARLGVEVGWPAEFGIPNMQNIFVWAATNHQDPKKRRNGEIADGRNFEGRHWTSTLPVMNLAIAICLLIEGCRKSLGPPISSLPEFGQDLDLLNKLIEMTNALAPRVEQCWPNRTAALNQPTFYIVPGPMQILTV